MAIFATLVVSAGAASQVQRALWTPPACEELAAGVPCRKLYEHPLGSTFVGPCPVESQVNPDGCQATFAGKADEDMCPQISCPKALGVTMKLVCGGGCCPTCWAPDHVIAMDRHTALENPATVDPAPQAPPYCKGVSCFEPVCAEGFQKGFVQGSCCYSSVSGRRVMRWVKDEEDNARREDCRATYEVSRTTCLQGDRQCRNEVLYNRGNCESKAWNCKNAV